jgi:hypothetical protein
MPLFDSLSASSLAASASAALKDVTGKLAKLTFTAYKDNKFSEQNKEAGEYKVMFNPASLSLRLQVEREDSQAPGTTSSEMKFVGIRPQEYTFDFIIDGTGATGEQVKSVPEEVEKFLKVVYDYKSEQHEPNFVMIRYGAVLLKCVLKSADITYNLFSPNGRPVRAKISCRFNSALEQQLSEMINSKSSSDLTHKRVLKQNEKLISLVNEIYNTHSVLIDVARANGLDTLRMAAPGSEVFFPPLNKK